MTNAGTDTISVMLGNGDGTFQKAPTYKVGNAPSAIATSDFNGDGKPDLAVAHSGSNSNMVSVLLNNGKGGFEAAQNYPVGTSPTTALSSIAVGDFNGDGNRIWSWRMRV